MFSCMSSSCCIVSNWWTEKVIKWVFYSRTSVLKHVLCYLWSELILLPEAGEYNCEPCMYLQYFVMNSWCSWSTPCKGWVSPGRWVLQKKKALFFWILTTGLIAVRGSAGSAGALEVLLIWMWHLGSLCFLSCL